MILWYTLWFFLAHEAQPWSNFALCALLLVSGFALEYVVCLTVGSHRKKRVPLLAAGFLAAYRVVQLCLARAWTSSVFPWALLMQMLPVVLLMAGLILGLKAFERRASSEYRTNASS